MLMKWKRIKPGRYESTVQYKDSKTGERKPIYAINRRMGGKNGKLVFWQLVSSIRIYDKYHSTLREAKRRAQEAEDVREVNHGISAAGRELYRVSGL